MKKLVQISGAALVVAMIVFNVSIFSNDEKTISVNLGTKSASAAVGTQRARLAYCQIIGDRTGCKNDPSRNCSSELFCD